MDYRKNNQVKSIIGVVTQLLQQSTLVVQVVVLQNFLAVKAYQVLQHLQRNKISYYICLAIFLSNILT